MLIIFILLIYLLMNLINPLLLNFLINLIFPLIIDLCFWLIWSVTSLIFVLMDFISPFIDFFILFLYIFLLIDFILFVDDPILLCRYPGVCPGLQVQEESCLAPRGQPGRGKLITSLSYHDPDPYSVAFCIRMRYRYSMPFCIWIYIQWLSVLGSVFGIRIRVPKKCQLP